MKLSTTWVRGVGIAAVVGASLTVSAIAQTTSAPYEPARDNDQITPPRRPDVWLTMKTKLALLTTEGVDTIALNVDTADGVVTLHGKVESEAEKTKAETVARAIQGVTEVRNLLQVVPARQKELVAETDERIKERVQKALSDDQMLAGSGIRVASVNKSVVLLSGSAKSLETHLKVVEAVKAVRGVGRVATEVQVRDVR